MSWPGLTVTEDDMKIDPDALEDAADRLQSELDTLISDTLGTPTNLCTQAVLPPGAFGGWQTARQMEDGYVQAVDSLLTCYDMTVQQLAAAIRELRTAATEARGEDEASGAAFGAEGAGVDTTGSAAAPVRVV